MFTGGWKIGRLSVAFKSYLNQSDHLTKNPVFSQGWPGKRGNPGRPGDPGPKVSILL